MHTDRTTTSRSLAGSGRGRLRGVVTAVAAAVATVAFGLTAPAQAAGAPAASPRVAPAAAGSSAAPRATPVGALPDGWTLTDGGATLTWTSPVPLPLGGARIDVVADGAVLGRGTVSPDRRRVSAPVGDAGLRDLASVQVVAAGRRLDAGPTSVAAVARSRATPAPKAAAPAAPAVPQTSATLPEALDPGRSGPYRTRTGEYSLAGLPVTGLPVPVEMKAVVVSPVGAKGRRPFALFLHGRHEPCYFLAGEPDEFPESFWPCPAGWAPVPSYRGYLQSQRLLASQGWVTASISANGINAQDFAADDGGALARSELVRAHLRQWARWARSAKAWSKAPAAVRSGPRPDLRTVFLVGHSRGGEGVNRAAVDSAVDRTAPYRIRGQLLLAPTAFGRNPTPGVPTAVVLPYCDGDVFDLQGQDYLDDARDLAKDPSLRGAVLVLGANHNFFNVEWTPGESVAPSVDDWFDDADPTCGTSAPDRLSPAQQRAVGATYTAAAAQVLALRRTAAEPLLDGSAVRAASAGPAVVRTHALGARRGTLLVPGTQRSVAGSGGLAVRQCDTEPDPETPAAACVPFDENLFGGTPHFPVGFFGAEGAPTRHVLEVRWTKASGSASVRLGRPVRLAGADQVALRVIAPPDASKATFAVRLRDADGTRAVAGTGSVTGLPASPPGTGMPGKYWAQEVRVALDAKALHRAGLDLGRVTGIELLPRSTTGRLWLLDAWGRDPGLAGPRPVPFVRVDVGRLTVDEGDSPHVVRLPVTVTGRLDRPARVWLGAQAFGANVGLPAGLPEVVTIPPRTRHLDLRVPVLGNTLDDEDLTTVTVFARGVRQAVPGDWVGRLDVRDDDPSPAVSLTRSATAVEGSPLRWTITLQRPSNREVFLVANVLPVPAPGVELDSDDVPADWLRDQSGIEPPPSPVPLSELGIFLFGSVAPGRTTGTLEIPTVADTRVEGSEQVLLRVPGKDEVYPGDPGTPGLPAGADLTGTVTDP